MATTCRAPMRNGKKTMILKILEEIALNPGTRRKDLFEKGIIPTKNHYNSYFGCFMSLGLITNVVGKRGYYLTEFGKEWFKHHGLMETYDKITEVVYF